MSFPKIVLTGSILVFMAIGVTAVVKNKRQQTQKELLIGEPLNVADGPLRSERVSKSKKSESVKQKAADAKLLNGKLETDKVKGGKHPSPSVASDSRQTSSIEEAQVEHPVTYSPIIAIGSAEKDDFPQIDRIYQLFTTGATQLPIVETITYNSSVPWLKGRPAWVADYAAHFATSRHFIARSLNGKPDYFTQKVSVGSRFNVFRKDKKINFYLLIDLSRCKMGFYYIDLDSNERVLLKTYRVGLGRLDIQKTSGSLTPIGKYSLGSKVAVYKTGSMGFFHDQKVEMISVFGTRWIPFGEELERCSAPAKGLGIQGVPWLEDVEKKQFTENRKVLGTYNSDGCIQLAAEDIEEIYSIVITKPTVVEIVKDFHEAKLPGVEVATPKR